MNDRMKRQGKVAKTQFLTRRDGN